MARQRLDKPRDRQVLVRLTEDEMQVLEAAAFLQAKSPAALAYLFLQEVIARAAADPHVADTIQIRDRSEMDDAWIDSVRTTSR